MIKKLIILGLFVCTSVAYGTIDTVVSVLPQKRFVKAIGGDRVTVSVMVLLGSSPHTYEPKPSQMKSIAKAKLYFGIGVEFEKTWLDRFKNLNSDLEIIDISRGIEKIEMKKDAHKNEAHADEYSHNLDPHIWLSPANIKTIALNIYKALIKKDPKNTKYYKKRLDHTLSEIDKTDNKIRSLLKGKSIKFMVFHPSWGYFAQEYGLTQMPIEIEGKSPKPKEIIKVIKRAKEQKISAIFTSPEFSDQTAKQIATELNIPVVKISPLAENWSENLIKFAKSLAR